MSGPVPSDGEPQVSPDGEAATAPFFSIVTVCRNSSSTIRKTAASLLEQRFQDWEWVVVDGGSTDATVEIIRGMAPSGNRLRLTSEPDNGIYHAMNKGVRGARGVYLHFLNADDTYADDAVLGEVAAKLHAHPETDFLYGNIRVVDADGNKAIHKPPAPDGVLDELVQGCLPHQASFARRTLFEAGAVGLFDERLRIASDYQWTMTLASRPEYRLHYFDRVMADFATTGASSVLENSLPETFAVLNGHTEFLEAIGPSRLIRAYQNNMLAMRLELDKLRAALARQTAEKIRAKTKLADATRLRDDYKEKLRAARTAPVRRPRFSWLPSWLRF